MISVAKAARMLKVSEPTVAHLLRRGKLRGTVRRAKRGWMRTDVLRSAIDGGKGYVSANKAAELLNLDPKTVRKHVRKGKLPGKIWKSKELVYRCKVDSRSIERVFWVICRWCGVRFHTRSPLTAMYCCHNHRDAACHVHRRKSR